MDCLINPLFGMFSFFQWFLQDMIPAKPAQKYVPRVYGFKVHESSLFYKNHEDGPQNQLSVDNASRQTRRSRDRNRRK
jgi:hypothetical protein